MRQELKPEYIHESSLAYYPYWIKFSSYNFAYWKQWLNKYRDTHKRNEADGYNDPKPHHNGQGHSLTEGNRALEVIKGATTEAGGTKVIRNV